MVAGDDEDRNAAIRKAYEALVGHIHNARGHFASKEEVAAMDHEVGIRIDRVIQDSLIVVEEVLTPPSTRGATSDGVVKPEMGVREEDDTNPIAAHRGDLGYCMNEQVG